MQLNSLTIPNYWRLDLVRREHPKAGTALLQVRWLSFVLPILFLAGVMLQPWVESKWMFLDALTAAELSGDCCHSYYGFVSTLGIMVWSATAGVCLFAAILLGLQWRGDAALRFAASAGLLTGAVALDDALLLHEVAFPSFGIPQNAVLATYLLLGVLYLLASWRIILKADLVLLAAAGSAMVLSIGVDTVFHSLDPRVVALEDGAKFFGIVCWAAFHISTLAFLLAPSDSPRPAPAQSMDRSA